MLCAYALGVQTLSCCCPLHCAEALTSPQLPRLIHRVSMVVMLRAAELDSILKETKKVPTQKYSEPIASSHEIGERQCVHPCCLRAVQVGCAGASVSQRVRARALQPPRGGQRLD